MYQGKYAETLTGTPQGGIISPLLANIYLHELDRYMESTYLNLSQYEKHKRRLQGKSNYLYVRYADDWVAICNGTKEQAYAMKEELRIVLQNMGLTLSAEKTKVTHITEGFTFLGYRITRGMGTRKMGPKVAIPESAIKKFRYKIRGMLSPSTCNESVHAKIMAMNQFIRGWCNYYRCTNTPSRIFNALNNEVYWSMVHWLGTKYKRSTPVIMQRYLEGSTFKTQHTKLMMPFEYKAKKLLVTTWHNPYTEKEAIIRERILAYDQIWNGKEAQTGWVDLREEVIIAKGTTCYICGTKLHASEVEIDHITPRKRFKDSTEADRMKHLQPVCTSCHRAKTKTDRKVQSRMP